MPTISSLVSSEISGSSGDGFCVLLRGLLLPTCVLAGLRAPGLLGVLGLPAGGVDGPDGLLVVVREGDRPPGGVDGPPGRAPGCVPPERLG